ncbi:MAG TPA: flavin-dependent oxidoreductase, partial [Pusillimonas sp.]|nr:flavin-dependent oxidoreductase [Pusillimonas sp.]
MKVIIVGAGIGGLTTALALHHQGIDCEIYEKVPTLLQQGVGLMLLPHASKVMEELGLLDALDKVGVRVEHTYFRTRHGQNVWDEPRGLPAGYDVPQFALHRGYLQRVLVDAVEHRMPGALHLDAAFETVEETANGVIA